MNRESGLEVTGTRPGTLPIRKLLTERPQTSSRRNPSVTPHATQVHPYIQLVISSYFFTLSVKFFFFLSSQNSLCVCAVFQNSHSS